MWTSVINKQKNLMYCDETTWTSGVIDLTFLQLALVSVVITTKWVKAFSSDTHEISLSWDSYSNHRKNVILNQIWID